MVLIDTHAFYAFNVWWIYFPQPPWRDQPGRAPGPFALAEEHAPDSGPVGLQQPARRDASWHGALILMDDDRPGRGSPGFRSATYPLF